MTRLRVFRALPRVAAALGPLLLVSNCGPDTPTGPQARPEAAIGGANPTVKSTVPSASPRDTSISVLVEGSGYDHGSRAVWALHGDTAFATTKIHVTSTTFLSSKELIADLTISADAPLDLYDVQVLTAGGKKGIGIERFEVTQGITTLPTLSGAGDGGIAINDAGTIVGFTVDEKGHFYAARWEKRGRIWMLDKLPMAMKDTKYAAAYDINDNGTAIGVRWDGRVDVDDQDSRATVWPNSGGVVDLGAGAALAISANGTVVGTRFDFNNSGPFNNQGVVWTRRAERIWDNGHLLPRLPNGHGTLAQGINTGGNIIVGLAADAFDVQHAVKWRLIGGQWQAPTLLYGGNGSVVALSINASGDVAGAGFPCEEWGGCSVQAMFWPSTGGRLDLGSLGISESNQIAGLSNSGEVVGFATTPEFRQYAFVWRPNAGTVVDLGNLLGDDGSEARDVNNHKQVVGSSFGPQGTRAVLWRVR
jgi:probable HAF family extracellular repeat protein